MTAGGLEKSFSFQKIVEMTSHVHFLIYLSEVWVLVRFQTANVTFKVIQGHSPVMVPYNRPHMISY